MDDEEGIIKSADVDAEHERVTEMMRSGAAPTDAIVICNLKKTFKSSGQKSATKEKKGATKEKKGTFTAVRKVNLVIPDNQLFCLLGHNGAGKTVRTRPLRSHPMVAPPHTLDRSAPCS